MTTFAGTRDLMAFALLETGLAAALPAALAGAAVSRRMCELEPGAGSTGVSEPSKARSSFNVNAVVVLGDWVSSLTVSASEAAGVTVIAILGGVTREMCDFASPLSCLQAANVEVDGRDPGKHAT